MSETIESINLNGLPLTVTPSTLKQPYAIYLRNISKNFGTEKSPMNVLRNINMAVPKGVIYGLLGPSGCGKTTLLSCIVGNKTVTSGEISVLGSQNELVGLRAGYMPQQLALYEELSIYQTLKYFGWISRMSSAKIEERVQFLAELMMFINTDQRVGTPSGGQQRRLSFAVAVLHEPELLILDEPTVGLDPLLRENIWDYLLKITGEGLTTVVLTTHYIDETKQAHLIGFLRRGTIVAEDSPQNLLSRFGVDSLEEAFLKLSVSQGFSSNESCANHLPNEPCVKRAKIGERINCNHMKPLIWKNFLSILRNPILMLTTVAVPIMQLLFFWASFGHDPRNLDVAVVNYETNNTKCENLVCNSTDLSCHYLQYLEEKDLNLIYYNSETEAKSLVTNAKVYGLVIFAQNYSLALKSRINNPMRLKEWDIQSSTVEVFRDVAIRDVSIFMKNILSEAFGNFIEEYLISCNESKSGLSMPIRYETPVYGRHKPDYAEFTVPGTMMVLFAFLSSAYTACSLAMEYNSGILERVLTMGVDYFQIMLSHIVTEVCVMICTLVLFFIIIFLILNSTLEGSLILLFILYVFSGFVGICLGFVIFTVCLSESAALHINLIFMFIGTVLGGCIWTTESFPYILQIIAVLSPFCKPIESARNITQRGWGLLQIYEGFLVCVIWILISLLISVFIFKLRKC